MESTRPVVIVGCGGHGRVIADIALSTGRNVECFLDDRLQSVPGKIPVRGPVRSSIFELKETHSFVVGIGDSIIRRQLSEFILDAGGELESLVHVSAIVGSDVDIGCGTVVMAGAVINTGARIGRFVVVNTAATIDHDATLEDNVHISPGCHLAGWVICRRDSFIGTGASIIPRVVVGEYSYVAAGATVIAPVRPHTLVAGCPATEKKTFSI